jgi:hypothetical protein
VDDGAVGGLRRAGMTTEAQPLPVLATRDLLGYLDAGAYYGYGLFLVLIGGVLGLFVPRWGPLDFEVFARAVFRTLTGEPLATTLNQYRFMKSMEFGFGIFMLLFRREIYTIPKFNRFFLAILFLGTAERVLSIAVDGRPHGAYIFFVGLETTIGLIILAESRRTLAAARQSSSGR